MAAAAVLVDVVLPCLDEVAALPWVLSRLPNSYRAVVVDNGSSDGSAEVAASLGAFVVTEPRRGYGSACHAGLAAASAPIVAFADCDSTFDLAQLPRVVDPVQSGDADLVLCRRCTTQRGAFPLHARLGNRELARRVRRRTGLPMRDLGPMRAARREDLLALGICDRRSGYPLETLVRAADAGWRIQEIDVDYFPRTGRSKVTGTWRGTLQAVRDLSRVLSSDPPRPRA